MLLEFKSGLMLVQAIRAALPVSKVVLMGSDTIRVSIYLGPISPLRMVFLSIPIQSQKISNIRSNLAIYFILTLPVMELGLPDCRLQRTQLPYPLLSEKMSISCLSRSVLESSRVFKESLILGLNFISSLNLIFKSMTVIIGWNLQFSIPLRGLIILKF